MKDFTNLFGTKIEFKPFYQSSVRLWRVARYENGELDRVNESQGFKSEKECVDSIK